MFHQATKQSLPFRIWYTLERRVKEKIFGCHMCGQCVLRSTALTCPMTCPKQLRNGPCGGSMNGACEVFPDKKCIWTQVYERGDRQGWLKKKLNIIQPAVDWSLYASSAWLNIWPFRRISADGHAHSPAPIPSGNIWENFEAREAFAREAALTGCGAAACQCGEKRVKVFSFLLTVLLCGRIFL